MGSASAVVAPVSAQGRAAGHLRVVDAPKFSALPHAIMRDTSLSRDARLLYAILQGYWWQDGECWASHATLAAEMGCTPRYLRVYLDELIDAELVVERLAGTRRSKVYTPASNTSKTSYCEPSNTKFSAVQSEVFDNSNTSKTSHSKKKTPVKKTQEEDIPPIGGSAAVAAAMPSEAPAKVKAEKRATRLPEDASLTDDHVKAAASTGLDRAAAEIEWPQFVDHHRARGSTMLDWLAAWRTWCRNSLKFGARRNGNYGASTRTSGTPTPKPPAADAPKWNRREY